MMRRIHWMGLAAAALLLGSPAATLAKNGADDVIPQPVQPEPEKTGYQLAKHGADDTVPQPVEPEPEKPGYQLAKHGADDTVPQPVEPEPEKPGIA